MVLFSGSFLWVVEIKLPNTVVLLESERAFVHLSRVIYHLLPFSHPHPHHPHTVKTKTNAPQSTDDGGRLWNVPPGQVLAPHFIEAGWESPSLSSGPWERCIHCSFHNPMSSSFFFDHKHHVLLAGQEALQPLQDLCFMQPFSIHSGARLDLCYPRVNLIS